MSWILIIFRLSYFELQRILLKNSNYILALISVILIFIGGGLSVVFTLEVNWISNLVKTVLPIKHSERLTHQLIESFQMRSLYSGIVLIVLGFYLFKIRNQIRLFLKELKVSYVEIVARAKSAVKRQFLKSNLKYTIPFFIILLTSILIRLYFLNGPLRYDEGFTYYYFSQKPVYLTMSFYEYPNNHIFHSLLVKFSCFIFGDSIVSLRLPALFFGVSLISIVYLYVGKFFSKSAALIAISLIALSSVLISYSVNARGYSLLFSAFVLLLVLVEILKRENNKFLWTLFILIQVVGIYTIPIMLYECMIVNSYFIFTGVFRRTEGSYLSFKIILKSALRVAFLSVLFYLPVYLLMGVEAIVANDYVKSRSYFEVFAILPDHINYLYTYLTMDFPVILQFALIGGILTSLIFYNYCRQVLGAVLFFLFCIFIIQRVVPFARVLVFLFPLFYIFSAIGIHFLITFFMNLKSYFYSIAICFILLIGMSFRIIRSESPVKEFDPPPIINQALLFPYLKRTLKKQDRLLFCFPLEASVKGYFMFNRLNIDNLENQVFKSPSVYFLLGNQFNQSVDLLLKKNDVDAKLFYSQYKLESKKDFDSTISIFEYRIKS